MKRLILILLTILAVFNLLVSLTESLSQPQIQSRLELYQTNLVLQALELQPDRLEDSASNNSARKTSSTTLSKSDRLPASLTTIIGENPDRDAQKQYQKAREEAQLSLTNLQTQLDKIEIKPDSKKSLIKQKRQLQENRQEIDEFIQELNLQIGILAANQGETEQALKSWRDVTKSPVKGDRAFKNSQVAEILTNLWSQSLQLPANSESQLKANLEGWFRDRALNKLYQQQNRQKELLELQIKEQELAGQSLLKLLFVAIIPILGGAFGVVLLLFLLAQRSIVKEKSLLATNGELPWQTPWDWETTWQVIIVGFFFIGQILLPFIFSLSGFNPIDLSLRYKAVYVLVSYVSMAVGGVIVLYYSIKPFFPLPKDWFRAQLLGNWFLWGFGGYTIAIPLVVVVSLLNQQLWHGQGGSNPLLYLALKSQDRVALALFFVTASIAAPIFEEFIFRGFLLPSLTRYMSVTNAILLSSLLFAIAHLSLSEVLPLTTLGIILGIVYTRSRNLLAPMLLHSLWNSGTLVSLFVLGSGVN